MLDVIDEKLSKIIIDEVKENIEYLIYRYENNLIEKNSYNDILFYSSILLNQNIDEYYDSKLKEIIIYILSRIKENFQDFMPYSIGMFDGLGQWAYSISTISKKTGELINLSYSLDEYLIDFSYNLLNHIKYEPIYCGLYDVISGISGVLYYFLDKKDSSIANNKMKLVEMINCLMNLSENYSYKGENIINFHIKKDQQTDKERQDMIEGHINFGLAHGIMGPLIALAKCKELGFYVKGLDASIIRLFEVYEKFCIRDDGVLKYPTKLPLQNYIKNLPNNLSFNCGWCYGNISIVRGLMKVSNILKRNEKYEYYKKELLNIINQPIEKYNLKSPIVCHGYSSVIGIQISAYRETKDKKFLNTLNRNLLKVIEEHESIISNDKEKNEEEINYKELYQQDYSILNGSGGVIMMLMNSISGDLKFNKILMVD
ncbi:hypothetical protein PZQ55_003798 [Clostridium botulinum]|nr:hypothetical protein [Clostridium botulinum]EKO1914639.1 hypothetical protein [Clostridium botulinum]EKO2041998.1 hypothetical protein [Clostridium botulinum]HDK7168653.1 hypothetical protein [Clostridium botulinum]HDK7169858.1 hypothetical protein [Clostridium botulinum]